MILAYGFKRPNGLALSRAALIDQYGVEPNPRFKIATILIAARRRLQRPVGPRGEKAEETGIQLGSVGERRGPLPPTAPQHPTDDAQDGAKDHRKRQRIGE